MHKLIRSDTQKPNLFSNSADSSIYGCNAVTARKCVVMSLRLLHARGSLVLQ